MAPHVNLNICVFHQDMDIFLDNLSSVVSLRQLTLGKYLASHYRCQAKAVLSVRASAVSLQYTFPPTFYYTQLLPVRVFFNLYISLSCLPFFHLTVSFGEQGPVVLCSFCAASSWFPAVTCYVWSTPRSTLVSICSSKGPDIYLRYLEMSVFITWFLYQVTASYLFQINSIFLVRLLKTLKLVYSS